MTLTQIAERMGLPLLTAHRLLTTLEQERYVHFDHERRLWSVGAQGVHNRRRLPEDAESGRHRPAPTAVRRRVARVAQAEVGDTPKPSRTFAALGRLFPRCGKCYRVSWGAYFVRVLQLTAFKSGERTNEIVSIAAKRSRTPISEI